MKIALIGYGYWGPNVARNLYRNKKFNFHIICDKREERIELAKQLYAEGVCYTTNFEEVVKNPEIEAIALAVETEAHYILAKIALEHGKHIYVEKPFTDNVLQAEELKKLAKKNNKMIHVDHIMVFHPAIRKIKEIITSGELGDIKWIDCSRLNLGQIKNDVSSMWDLSVHDLAIIDYLTDGEKVDHVKAMGIKVYSERESITQLTVQYDSFFASLRSSWFSPIKERKLIVTGTKKMIVYDDVDVLNKLIVYDKGFDMEPGLEYADYVIRSRNGDAVIPKLTVEDALFNSLEHFRESCESGIHSITDADAAIRVIKTLELADISLENKGGE